MSTLRIIEGEFETGTRTREVDIDRAVIVTKPILKTTWRETTFDAKEGKQREETTRGERVNRLNRVQAETSSGSSDQSEWRSILRAALCCYSFPLALIFRQDGSISLRVMKFQLPTTPRTCDRNP